MTTGPFTPHQTPYSFFVHVIALPLQDGCPHLKMQTQVGCNLLHTVHDDNKKQNTATLVAAMPPCARSITDAVHGKLPIPNLL